MSDKYFVIFVKFLMFKDGVGYCQVSDSGALRSAILLAQDGFFSIPKTDSLVQVIKSDDGDYLYIIGSRTNNNIINIDNNNKTIEINNCDEYSIIVNGDVNIDCNNAVIRANNVDLGDTGGGLVTTVSDTWHIPTGEVIVSVTGGSGAPAVGVLNTAPITITTTTVTEKTRAR